MPETRILVDLDAEEGRKPREGRENQHRVRIAKASNGKIRMSLIQAYLDGTVEFDTHLLEAISKRHLPVHV